MLFAIYCVTQHIANSTLPGWRLSTYTTGPGRFFSPSDLCPSRLAIFGPYDTGRPPFSSSDFCAKRNELERRAGGPSGAYDASATYSLSPAVICVAEMSSPASEASRHFQSVKAGWS